MTTDLSSDEGQGGGTGAPAPRLDRLEANLRTIDELSRRVAAAMAHRRQVPASLQGPSKELFAKAAGAWMAEAMADPARLIEQQATYWGQSLKAFAEAQAILLKGGAAVAIDDAGAEGSPRGAPSTAPRGTPPDRRFANPLWDTHPWFAYVKRQYLLNAEAVSEAVATIPGLSPRDARRLDYFTRQLVDMLAPTNFLATNPDALERAIETDGQSLVDGLGNLVRDLEAGEGDLVVRLADDTAFRVGGNLATTPGEVVFRNRLFELIQYRPVTDTVRNIPLVVFPPWINKFYVLDLTARNSLVRWIVEQGFSLFVVSWVNPDATYRDVTMTDYVEDGFVAAIREVRAICGTKRVNAVGYCIAGTTLAITLALMKRRGERSVASATFLTTLTDFADQGEVGVFLDDDFVDGIEAEASRKGLLESFYMARTFSYLRSNDLIYQPAIRSYMMGQPPPAFDLLYWNGDSTNLPAPMAIDYLRNLCQANRFAGEGFAVAGEVVRLADVTVPLCAIACETDHIAAWRSSFRGIQRMRSEDRTFILSESGHIAGIVNPPSKGKYGHWTNDDLSPTPEGWLAGADKHDGTWWGRWGAWLGERSGRMVPARLPGAGARPSLGPAPGTYVTAVPDA